MIDIIRPYLQSHGGEVELVGTEADNTVKVRLKGACSGCPSARLTLPWLLGALGAPTAFVGFLVPIREAGVLVPQLMVAAFIRRMPIRKTVWMAGALLTAGALVLMALSARSLSGATAGWALVGLLHDLDYERWPTAQDHPYRGAEILEQRGYPEWFRRAVLSHAS